MQLQSLAHVTRIIVGVLGLGLMLNAGLAWADFVPPSNLGRPGNREGAATRGTCKFDLAEKEPGLTALIPRANIGLTTAANPTVFWYLPKNNYQVGEMMLYKATETEQTLVDRTTFLLEGRPTLDRFTWANQTLAPNQDYRWVLSLICDPANPDPSQIVYVEGWVRRVDLAPNVQTALANAQGLNRFQIFAKAGLWYDALTVLAKQPTSAQVRQEWAKLLTAETVQLPTLGRYLLTSATTATTKTNNP
ncbi:DUF928 domain-containing protein [Thermosynechococcaceae cyanobacterium BACA0444]|uniref:DUF928 domain-containing protein n=1 Tax=Pseudocalidococcus azoricus BACA0444 TaxID=2918990 RepID=A0AAE4FT13_9CYAN|nr:DUF928 domain-containing protein [Pseudocalidococcus azoricus]MDS3861680.1 DUF928 domain-containing protein [Pseudocalidococcus azoricus BACA0444]